MKEQILEHLHDNGPKTVYQIADALQADIDDVSLYVAGMVLGEEIYLEPADGTLWYAEES